MRMRREMRRLAGWMALGMAAAAISAAGCADSTASGDIGDGARPDNNGGGEPDPAGSEVCDNGIDDDGDGVADEGCACTVGESASCYGGEADVAGVGACAMGEWSCELEGDLAVWGECQGWVAPSEETCDDGIDNDCDGSVDEECGVTDPDACKESEVRPCFDGPAEAEGVGACQAGSQTCADETWGACEGAVLPAEEVVGDSIDNDCDGTVDEPIFTLAQLDGGHWHACGTASDGSVYCWGENADGQLGDGTTQPAFQPRAVNTSLRFDALALGYMFSCGLVEGKAYCWGDNASGQLGDGTTSVQKLPTAVQTPLRFLQLAAGEGHVCGLSEAGETLCWGNNQNAQIGTGSTFDRQPYPRPVDGAPIFQQITAGQLHTCGLTDAGEVYCWGYAGHGQIGDGSSAEPFATSPRLVDTRQSFVEISAGYRHTCGRTAAGALWCWGDGTAAQLGDGSAMTRTTPVQVQSSLIFESVSAGFFSTCAIADDDSLHCWGQNASGELGDGTTDPRLTPTPVSSPLAFDQVAPMVDATCAREVGGEVYCWGENGHGQLGSSASQTLTPVPLGLP